MLKLGLMSCALCLCLTACAKCPPARPMLPPTVYLQEVEEPKFVGQSNRHLLAWALEMREALRLANSDKKALREWAGDVSK